MDLSKISQARIPESTGSYDLLYLQNEPSSLTMTANPKNIHKQLYQLANFLWIDPSNNKNSSRQKLFSETVGQGVMFFESVIDAEQRIKKLEQVIIICGSVLVDEIQYFFKKEIKSGRIYSIICYKDNKSYRAESNSSRFNFVQSEEEVYNHIKQKRPFYNKANFFVNFLPIYYHGCGAEVKILFSMVHQKTNRKEILKKLGQLAQMSNSPKYTQIQEFLSICGKDQLNIEQTIRLYTKESFLYGLTNRVLRNCLHPTSLYIIQPFFQDLFRSIRQIYKQQRKYIFHRRFTCYRGTFISKQEFNMFKNNQIFHSFGFMSATLDKNVAIAFMDNVLFQIDVQDVQYKQQFDFGYASVEKYSHYEDEKQIIFNPLNTFKVTSVKQKQNKYTIKLKYGQLARIMKNSDGDLTEKQIKIKYMSHYQFIEDSYQFMGDLLKQIDSSLISKYLDKYLQIAEIYGNKYFIIDASLKKAQHIQSYCTYQKYESLKQQKSATQITKAINDKNKLQIDKYLEKSQQLLESIEDKNNKFYFKLLYKLIKLYEKQDKKSVMKRNYFDEYCEISKNINVVDDLNCAEVLFMTAFRLKVQGYYQEALKILLKCQEIQMKLLGQNHPTYAQTLNFKAIILRHLRQYEEAESIYIRSLKILKRTRGYYNSQYANILSNFGIFYLSTGKISKAKATLEKCLKINQVIYPQTDRAYLYVLYNLSQVYNQMGKYQQALKLISKRQLIQRTTIGEQNNSYTCTLSILAQTYDHLGQHQKAFQFIQKCYKNIQYFGFQHRSAKLISLGEIYEKYGQNQLALKFYQESQQIRRFFEQNWHKKAKMPEYANILQHLGIIHCKLGQQDIGVKYLLKCCHIFKQHTHAHYFNLIHRIAIQKLKQIYIKNSYLVRSDLSIMNQKISESLIEIEKIIKQNKNGWIINNSIANYVDFINI